YPVLQMENELMLPPRKMQSVKSDKSVIFGRGKSKKIVEIEIIIYINIYNKILLHNISHLDGAKK
ncbi:MAG: hypothetical protein II999_05670, partial [Bacteroidaceae bacterium]|nr:hypothetical protein [Bacteroidaceae bacterium]